MKVSRTIGPIHFEDLEPHRFEDLVRQLAYDFRPWSRLEATGRAGADDGVDILAVESPAGADDDADEAASAVIERLWMFQCKREKSIAPKKLVSYVTASLAGKQPHGFVLAAACDFSKKARDAFRASVAEHNVSEAHLWGKAELEDALFLPKNAHLLFAYFGVSLQVRRRSRRMELTQRIAMKRKLVSFLPLDDRSFRFVLIRDASSRGLPVHRELHDVQREPPLDVLRMRRPQPA